MAVEAKAWLDKLNQTLIETLSSTLGIPVFQDSVSPTELAIECQGKYHYVIFTTGGMRRVDSKKFTLIQDVLVHYFAEGVDNLDADQVAVISAMEQKPYTFVMSEKTAIQKGSADAYVDGITFTFTRPIKYVC